MTSKVIISRRDTYLAGHKYKCKSSWRFGIPSHNRVDFSCVELNGTAQELFFSRVKLISLYLRDQPCEPYGFQCRPHMFKVLFISNNNNKHVVWVPSKKVVRFKSCAADEAGLAGRISFLPC